MNCSQANEMSIAGFLMSKDIVPAKRTGNNFWYCSPLRNDKDPSFKIDGIKNLWYDFGTGTGGRLVDLVCKMYNVGLPGALLILSGMTIETPDLSFPDQQNDLIQESRIEIKNVQPLRNTALIQYLESRKIDTSIAVKYCREAYYKTTASDKQYFSVAFENDLHGFELRNKYFKNSSSPKTITTIPGESDQAVNVFEGFMDFLSALTWFKTDQPANDTIVLNGAGFIDDFIYLMPKYARINLFLDNDTTGKEKSKHVQNLRPDAINRSVLLYPKYKDFNDFIIAAYVNQTMQVPK